MNFLCLGNSDAFCVLLVLKQGSDNIDLFCCC